MFQIRIEQLYTIIVDLVPTIMSKDLFVKESTLHEHLAAFAARPGEYEEELANLLELDVGLTPSTKGRAAAILWNAGSRRTVDSMIAAGHMEVAELGTMLKLVDGPRQRRQLEQKLLRLRQSTGGVKKSTLKSIEILMARFDTDGILPASGSGANSALMKRVQRWCRTLSAERLQFFLMNFPVKPWQELADLVHLKQSDFAMESFLPIVFGEKPASGTLLADVTDASVEALPLLLRSHPSLRTCYSYIRKR